MSALQSVVHDALKHQKNDATDQEASPKPHATPGVNTDVQHPSSSRKNSTSAPIPSTSLDADDTEEVEDPEAPNFYRNNSVFRGPLESPVTPPRSPKSKKRNSWLGPSSENEGFFRRWVEEPLGLVSDEDPPSTSRRVTDPTSSTSTPNQPNGHITPKQESGLATPSRTSKPVTWDESVRTKFGLRKRVESAQPVEPDSNNEDSPSTPSQQRPPAARLASRRWAMLKNRLTPGQNNARPGPSSAVSPDVNISDELLGGGLATLMLKMHFDRDEQNKRRVPVLLHHLKIRVSDSIHPLKGTHTVFRIEVCVPYYLQIQHSRSYPTISLVV